MVEAHHWRTFLLMSSMAEFPFYKRLRNSSENNNSFERWILPISVAQTNY